jgi:VanZ family protein
MSKVETTQRNSSRDLICYWLPPLTWMGMIFYLSAQPTLPSATKPLLDVLIKKGGHFGAYALLAFWWWRALSRGRGVEGTTLGLAFAVSVAYAISDEFHQGFVPGRNPSLVDVLIDTAGAAAALWMIWRWRGKTPRSRNVKHRNKGR